ncbi:hypothetical protein [Aminobacterium colombiense]
MATPQLTKYAASTLPVLNDVLTFFSSRIHRTVRHQSRFEARSGLVQTSEASQYTRNTWAIIGYLLTNADKEAFEAFWEGRKGICIPFKWTDDTKKALHYVRFADSEIAYQRIKGEAWTVEFDIESAHPLEIDVEA